MILIIEGFAVCLFQQSEAKVGLGLTLIEDRYVRDTQICRSPPANLNNLKYNNSLTCAYVQARPLPPRTKYLVEMTGLDDPFLPDMLAATHGRNYNGCFDILMCGSEFEIYCW